MASRGRTRLLVASPSLEYRYSRFLDDQHVPANAADWFTEGDSRWIRAPCNHPCPVCTQCARRCCRRANQSWMLMVYSFSRVNARPSKESIFNLMVFIALHEHNYSIIKQCRKGSHEVICAHFSLSAGWHDQAFHGNSNFAIKNLSCTLRDCSRVEDIDRCWELLMSSIYMQSYSRHQQWSLRLLTSFVPCMHATDGDELRQCIDASDYNTQERTTLTVQACIF